MVNTHYGLLVFGGDLDDDHPDPALRGRPPGVELIACGPFEFCWASIEKWTAKHPLRRDECAEVVERMVGLATEEG